MKNIRNNIDKILEAIIFAYGVTGVVAIILTITITATNPANPKASIIPLYVVIAFGLSFFLLIALAKAIVKRHYIISSDWQTIYDRKHDSEDTAVAISSHFFDTLDDYPVMLLTSDVLSKHYVGKLRKKLDPTFRSTVGVQTDTKLLTRNVYIKPENIVIENDADSYRIAKLELQPIEGYYVQCFKLKSDTRESQVDGYLRITFEPVDKD